MGKTRVNSADYTQASGANNIKLKMGDTKRKQCTRAGMGNNKLEWELQKKPRYESSHRRHHKETNGQQYDILMPRFRFSLYRPFL